VRRRLLAPTDPNSSVRQAPGAAKTLGLELDRLDAPSAGIFVRREDARGGEELGERGGYGRAPPTAPESTSLRTTAASSRRGGLASLWLAGFPVELLLRKRGGPLEKRCPDGERGRADRVVDEVADKSFDAWAFEHEDHGLFREKDAVPPKASQCEPVRRALGKDLNCPLTRAWQELGNDRHALGHVVVINARRCLLATEQPRHNVPEQPARRADAVVEGDAQRADSLRRRLP
jgi:hypothetical protein